MFPLYGVFPSVEPGLQRFPLCLRSSRTVARFARIWSENSYSPPCSEGCTDKHDVFGIAQIGEFGDRARRGFALPVQVPEVLEVPS